MSRKTIVLVLVAVFLLILGVHATAARPTESTSFFVPAIGGRDLHYQVDIARNNLLGVALADTAHNQAFGEFVVPDNFASGLTVEVLVLTDGTGSILWYGNAMASAPGEPFNTHEWFWPETTATPTRMVTQGLGAKRLDGLGARDLVLLAFSRQGMQPGDTLTTAMYVSGWIVSYNGKP